LEKGHRFIFERIAQAKERIPRVMVEMPVLPGTLDVMKDVLLELERLDIHSINLLEFCYPFINAEEFNRRGYQVKMYPFQVLYDYWYAGGLPVAKSELDCLDLLEFAIDQGLKIGVHYCSLENKNTGQIFQQNSGQKYSNIVLFSKKDYFLKTAKVFGGDIPRVLEVFKRKQFFGYQHNYEYDFLEFHARNISILRKMDVEVGISTQVIERRGDDDVIRELKVDLTTPCMFNLAKDV
jgi:hypothetical protein